MAYKLGNRVLVPVTNTPGNASSFTLSTTAVPSFQTFEAAGVANNDTCPYFAQEGTLWEIGVGTYSTTGPTLARTTVIASSAGGTTKATFTSAVIVGLSPLAAGVTNGSSAATGDVGEYVENYTTEFTGASLTDSTLQVAATLTLSAGDWELRGTAGFYANSNTGATTIRACVSTVAGGLAVNPSAGTFASMQLSSNAILTSTARQIFALSPYRALITSTTTYYLSVGCQATSFTPSPVGYGHLSARRMR